MGDTVQYRTQNYKNWSWVFGEWGERDSGIIVHDLSNQPLSQFWREWREKRKRRLLHP